MKIIHRKDQAIKYIEDAFNEGVRQYAGPNIKMGNYLNRIVRIIKDPQRIMNRLTAYKLTYNEIQKGFVIFQEYISHDFEWRVVKIGRSYFGHQKIKQGEKASGTKGINYISPPDRLLDFVKQICDKYNFNSMAIDIFEDGRGGYLINEMQTAFGHVQDHICEKDGEPGRFLYEDNCWQFEKGMFNTNLSYDLRLEHVLSLLNAEGK